MLLLDAFVCMLNGASSCESLSADGHRKSTLSDLTPSNACDMAAVASRQAARLRALETLQLPSATDAEVLRAAYFEQALSFHPDLRDKDDSQAAAMFRQLSEAYWVLANDSVPDFSMQSILELWVTDFALEVSSLPEIVATELQLTPEAESIHRHFEVATAAKGIISGERLRCELCGFQVRGHGEMKAHFLEMHHSDAKRWADGAVRVATSSFLDFMTSSAGVGSGHFPLADGSCVRLKPQAAPDGLGGGSRTEDGLEQGLRPSGVEGGEDPSGTTTTNNNNNNIHTNNNNNIHNNNNNNIHNNNNNNIHNNNNNNDGSSGAVAEALRRLPAEAFVLRNYSCVFACYCCCFFACCCCCYCCC
ncbi:unnamed protein product [Polarella glacialis]|uniref:J domain-containing protein n=1 Tax=Polarella glacialis TaxID=89957 RepID=A0A813HME7_POLGL|nr:unnamed protein product [Polarella glacialis]